MPTVRQGAGSERSVSGIVYRERTRGPESVVTSRRVALFPVVDVSREPGMRSLLNALEVHVEEGDGYPAVVASFESLFCDIAAFRKVNARTVSDARRLPNPIGSSPGFAGEATVV